MKIAVIGAGSAGVISAAQICANVPNGFEVVSIYDPNTKILGIGESTNSGFIKVLEQACGFSFMDDLDAMDSTLKFGNKFMDWRADDWFNPLLDGGVAIHINNFKLKDFVFPRLAERFPLKFKTMEGLVDDIVSVSKGADVVINGVAHHFDHVIDTRGFPKDYTGYTIVNSLPLNHGIIHTEYKPGDWQYTEHRATANGWMFGIPLQKRRTYGYMFNDTVTSVEEAYDDICRIFNVDMDNVGRIEAQVEYQFKSYYANTVYEGSVLKNGNRAIFFEPISASSIYFYVYTNYIFIEFLKGIITESELNARFVDYAQQLEDMICFFYHGGSTFDTPFWAMAKERTTAHLMKSKNFRKALTDCYHKNQIGLPHYADGWVFSGYHLNLIDEKFGYNYFTDPIKNKKTIQAIEANLNMNTRIIL